MHFPFNLPLTSDGKRRRAKRRNVSILSHSFKFAFLQLRFDLNLTLFALLSMLLSTESLINAEFLNDNSRKLDYARMTHA